MTPNRLLFVVLVACAALAPVVAGVVPSPVAAGPTNAAGNLAADPPAGVTYTLAVSMSSGGGMATIAVRAAYPARSDSEAATADEGALSPDWFDGERRVRTVFERVADEDDELTSGARSSWHAETDWDATPREPEHGWVTVEYTVGWRDFFGPEDDRAEVGEAFAAVLQPGDRLVVAVPSHWQPETVRGDPRQRSSGEAATEYVWTVGEGGASPEIAFGRDVLATATASTDGQDAGPAGGFGVTAVAILASALLAWTRLDGDP